MIRYHYTSADSLTKMIENEEIRFTDIRYLNDTREFRHACDMLILDIKSRSVKHRQKWLDRGCKEAIFDGMVNNICKECSYESAIFLAERDMWLPYVFCLSKCDDSLSQWRAYGNGEYCIGFDIDKLCHKTRSKSGEVVYRKNGEESAGEPLQALDNFFERHANRISQNGEIHPETFYRGAQNFINILFRSSFFWTYKDDGFREEAEVRLVNYPVRAVSKELKLEPGVAYKFLDASGRDARLRCKVKIESEKGGNGIVDCIEEIVCGPGANQERCRASIRFLEKQYNKRIKIRFSSIPYKPV